MSELANRAEALAALRKPFPADNIAKLPKVNCYNCTQANKQQRNTTCSDHRMAKCRVCSSYITTGHIHLDYVGHAEATDRLLDADPEWTWEPLAIDGRGLPAFDDDGGMWIRLTVGGVTRLGYGSADGKRGPNAIKEVIGDAIRNAGMRFGMALDLWAKTDLHADEREESEAGHIAGQQDRDAEAPQDRPAHRQRGRANDEWNTATGQPLPPPAPGMPSPTVDEIAEIVRLLGVKRSVFNGQCARVVSKLVQRRVDDPHTLSQSEARSIIETLTAEDDNAQAAVEQPPGPVITKPQQRMMQAMFKTAGITDRDGQHAFITRVLGTPVTSRNNLTPKQFDTIIAALSPGEVPPAPDGPAPSDEGISEFDALDQMILDVASGVAGAEVEKAIAAELDRKGITRSDAELLLERLGEHVRQAKAGATG